jgi:hypothetical protein
MQVYVTLYLYAQYRYRRANTMESFLYGILIALRVAVLALAYFAWPRLSGWYLIAFFGFAVLLKRQPYAPRRSMVAALRDYAADEVLQDRSQPPQQVVLLYSLAGSDSRGFLRSFHALARRYSSPCLRFYAANIDADPMLARRFNLDLSIFSRQVPTVMLLSRGRARDQLPLFIPTGSAAGAASSSAASGGAGDSGKVLALTPRTLEQGFQLAQRSAAVLDDCADAPGPGASPGAVKGTGAGAK